MNKFSSPLLSFIIHVVATLLASIVKRLDLMPMKILMCPTPNEAIINLLLERFLKSACSYIPMLYSTPWFINISMDYSFLPCQ